ncbi:nuclear apoptosis-inducing factor 1 [Chanos chanos]|uniref:Nuclear apoptosis-inducing factor 1 n=1 Tax=Chanos chanos TaxID=29144 RepID=A0A6J2VS52_CHACN|nr:nuclear apoptosis-inducing factor 1-like [Chanos chanos]
MSGHPYFRGLSSSSVRFKKRKSRFSFEEVRLLLSEVKKNRHILVGKFNRGVSSDVKKRTWAALTARINEISECHREILEIIKKWSDLKCDTKRKVAAMKASGASPSRIMLDLSPIESMVHQVLQMPVTEDPSGLRPTSNQNDHNDVDDDEDCISPIRIASRSVRIPNGKLVAHGKGKALPAPVPPDKLVPPPDMMYRQQGLRFHEPSQEQEIPSVFSDQPIPKAEHNHQVTNSPTAEPGCLQEQLATNARLSLQEQQTTTALIGTLSRSLESLAGSIQRLVETQQEFARDSLRMQRDTLHVLHDFSASALTILHDKLSGHP